MEILSSSEARRLVALEKIIKRGKKTFLEVGHALAEIRDRRLYRSEYPSLESYCQKNWGWLQKPANQVIIASEVVKQLPAPVSATVGNDGHATRPAAAQDLDIEQILKWWRETPPAIRADFITRILNSDEPVLVQSKDHFTARVTDWLVRTVQDQPKPSPAVQPDSEPGKTDTGQSAPGPVTRPVLPAPLQAYRQAYKVLDAFLRDGKWRSKLEMTHVLRSHIEPAVLVRLGNRNSNPKGQKQVSDASDFAARQLAGFYCRRRSKSGKIEVSENGSMFRKKPARYA